MVEQGRGEGVSFSLTKVANLDSLSHRVFLAQESTQST